MIQTPSTVITKTFETSASINLRPPPIDRHKSFDEDDFSRKPIVPKKAHTPPRNFLKQPKMKFIDNGQAKTLTKSIEKQRAVAIQTPSTVITKTFETSASINLRPPPIDRHKSFDEDDFSRKPIVPKKVHTPPVNAISYSIADLQMATDSFSVETLVGEGSKYCIQILAVICRVKDHKSMIQ
ncbi:Protein STRUBBELIG-RECEPTOR FAMILY 6 [Camellia lanceoleosa]|uniref:Protein STRUBBELIG-RECEPTOR FAMILY 6 n=1 Tax=Camellia lanceoleosa TaxID=1840588 RepID=A0ACC0F753_9ERIC|nr:Protein STRUBBELIG-RECEPTOR FAMILY 6 [Camellia lanceoleosa]